MHWYYFGIVNRKIGSKRQFWSYLLFFRSRMNFSGIIIFLTMFSHLNAVGQSTSQSLRQPRSLIFPPTTPTRLQFICGIGIPVEELQYESITSGYVLKAEYFLPTNVTQLDKNNLRPQTIQRRRGFNSYPYISQGNGDSSPNRSKIKQKNAPSYRWILYSAMEQMTSRMNKTGRDCILRIICEVARAPFHSAGGILSEIIHIILTPSSSLDIFHHNANKEYSQAEIQGRNYDECARLYTKCPESVFNKLSSVFTKPFTVL